MPRTPVSIGLPCFNNAATLPLALRSIVAQTRQDWELIAVDDGSTDATPELLRSADDPRIRVIIDGENRRLPARLNQIAAEARGRFLVRMDADDVMFPERLERQIGFLETHPDIDLLGSGMVCVDTDNRPVSMRLPPASADSAFRVLAGEVLYHPTVAGSTEWFRRHRYDENCARSQDFELWARTAGQARIRNLPEPLLFYREVGATSWAKYREHTRMTKQIIRRYGPGKVGAGRTAWLLGRRYMKDLVYAALATAGQWERAVALRNRPLTGEQRMRVARIMAALTA